MSASRPKFSVIIPAYNAHATLPGVLRALEPHVAGGDCEVVLVDSSGAANGVRVAQEWPWAQLVCPDQRTLPGRARNLGAAVARGELLVFLDADTIPAPGWLAELERALTPGVELVSGAILDGSPDSPWGTVSYMLEFLEWIPERRTSPGHAASCNMLLRRAVFEREGGFPEDLWPGEDTVFSVPFAVAGTLAFARGAQVTHLNRTARREVLAHQRRLGASWVEVCSRVTVPGGRLAVPHLALLAVLGRCYSLARQLREYPGAPQRRPMRHGLLLLLGLLAWGTGVMRPARGVLAK